MILVYKRQKSRAVIVQVCIYWKEGGSVLHILDLSMILLIFELSTEDLTQTVYRLKRFIFILFT